MTTLLIHLVILTATVGVTYAIRAFITIKKWVD